MLKIEKVSQDHHLKVFFRLKNGRFNQTFFIALGCALAIHLFGLILFRVNPFTLGKERILAPTMVEADLHLPESSKYNILAQPETEGGTIHYLLPPPLWQPFYPEVSVNVLQSQFEYIKEENSPTNPFIRIEYDSEALLFSEAAAPKKPIEMHVIGELATLALLENGMLGVLDSHLSQLPDLSTPLRVIYTVQVEGKSGKIFWYLPLELTPNSTLNQLSETLIAGLSFEKNHQQFVTSGEIEILFNKTENGKTESKNRENKL